MKRAAVAREGGAHLPSQPPPPSSLPKGQVGVGIEKRLRVRDEDQTAHTFRQFQPFEQYQSNNETNSQPQQLLEPKRQYQAFEPYPQN